MDVHYDDEVLVHYGKKGMRWKIRRNDQSTVVSDTIVPNRQSSALKGKAKVQQDSIVPNRQSSALKGKAKVQQDSIVSSARRASESRMTAQRDAIVANKRGEKILTKLDALRKKKA